MHFYVYPNQLDFYHFSVVSSDDHQSSRWSTVVILVSHFTAVVSKMLFYLSDSLSFVTFTLLPTL